MDKRIRWIFGLLFVAVAVLGAFGVIDFGTLFGASTGVGMAFAAVATPGIDGAGKHLSGEGNGLSLENANMFSPEMISHEYDRKVVMMGLGGVPVNTFMRHLPHKRINSMEFGYFSVDLRQVKAVTTGTAVAAGGVQQNVEVGALHSIFDISDQIYIEGVNGHKKGEATPTVDLPYNAIVIGKTTDPTPKLIIQPINGKPIVGNEGNTEGLAIPTGTNIYRITNLVDEAQNYNGDTTAYPLPTTQFMQIFMTTISETELSQSEKKEIDWGKVQMNQLAMHEMMRDEEAATFFGIKNYTKQLQPKTRWVYTFDGFEAQALKGGSPVITKSKAALLANNGEAELVDLLEKVFVGNSGSNERYMFAGSGVISTLSKIKLSDKRPVLRNEGTYAQFGVTFTKMSSNFGTLYIYLHPTMDVYGRKDTAFIVDLSYADKMIREPLRSDDIDVSEFRGDKKRVLETFAPVFKYPKSHAIFKLTA